MKVTSLHLTMVGHARTIDNALVSLTTINGGPAHIKEHCVMVGKFCTMALQGGSASQECLSSMVMMVDYIILCKRLGSSINFGGMFMYCIVFCFLQVYVHLLVS